MKIYIRKLDNQCFSHQISVPKYVRDDFFDGAPNDAELNFKGKSTNQNATVLMKEATDWRLGGEIKKLMKTEDPTADVDDLFVVYKGTSDYTLEIIKTSDSRYETLMGLYTNSDRHIFIATGAGETIMSSKHHPLNQILYGAPGTGKTHSTAIYALAIIENVTIDSIEAKYNTRELLMNEYRKHVSNGNIKFCTFHQNYSYEDFVQGLRPDKITPMKFNDVDGVFKVISDDASKKSSENFVLIIDEINRANISKVFGELITLIEPDKRKGEINELEVILPSGTNFSVPNNLYILGTMNSADKSISLIDAALRRRFKFIEISPNSALVKDDDLKAVLSKLNHELYTKLKSTDLLVGHSYFLGKNVADLEDIMNDQIIPLLYEYFYDNKEKVKEILKASIDNTKYSILESEIQRLKIKKI